MSEQALTAIAGIALFGTTGNSLAAARREEVTASGLTLGGVGSAFWGLLAGVAVLPALRRRQRA